MRMEIAVLMRWIVISSLLVVSVYSLTTTLPKNNSNRRQFVSGVSSSFASSCIISNAPAVANSNNDNQDILPLLESKTIHWDVSKPWADVRYSSSTLQQSSLDYAPPASNNPIFYPTWMEGYHTINYKFKGASFPQGRQILTLRTPGAGLGTCLSLPNIGYNPSTFPIHFIRQSRNGQEVYEDLAYNVPRIFEAFWPQSKVLSIPTNYADRSNRVSNDLTPKCLVTGDGCSVEINPNLHKFPATRLTIDFDGPTRRGGSIQSIDATMLDTSVQSNIANDSYYTTKTFSQYNMIQDLQLFYKEISSFQRKEEGNVVGKVRVAAFLPKYIQAIDSSGTDSDSINSYDDNEAVAIYDYNVFIQRIDETEASAF